MSSDKDDIINVQQAQIQKLLKRLNELNNDHETLLEQHKNNAKTPNTISNKFGIFGQGLKRRISNLTTPKRSTSAPFAQQGHDTSFRSSHESQFDFLLPITSSTLYAENKSIQTTPILPIRTRNVNTQTITDKSEDNRKQSKIEKQLMEKNYTLTKHYTDLQQLYDDLLHKHNLYHQKIDIRDDQLKDIAIERNKLRKQLESANEKNMNLMHILEMKSKVKLDPDIRQRDNITKNMHLMNVLEIKSNMKDAITEKRNHSETIPKQNQSEHTSRSNSRSNSISKHLISLNSLSPIKLTTLFKPTEKTEQKVTNDSVTLANKLMKVIQDKDAIIIGLRAQLNYLKNYRNSND